MQDYPARSVSFDYSQKKKKKKNLFSKLAYKIKTNKKSRNGWLPERPYGHRAAALKTDNNNINARFFSADPNTI